jgi:hypothetical protein
MPLNVDGVYMPVEAQVNQASFKAAEANIDELLKRQAIEQQAIERNDKAVQEAGKNAVAAEKARQQAMRASVTEATKLQMQINKIGQAGRMTAAIGTAAVGGIFALATKYAASAKDSEQASRDWMLSMQMLDNSANQVGRAAATALNPALRETAEIIGKISEVIAQNPEMLQGAAAAGVGLAGVGTLVSVAASVASTVMQLQKMVGTGGASGAIASTASSIVSVALVAIAADAGLVLGTAVANAINGGDTNYNPGDALKAIAMTLPTLAQMAGIGSQGAFVKTSDLVDKILSKIPGMTPRELKTPDNMTAQGRPVPAGAGSTGITPGPRRKDFEAIQQEAEQNAAVLNYRKEALEERAKIEKEADKKRLDATKDFESTRLRIEQQMQKMTADYLKANKQAEIAWQTQRAQITRAAKIEEARREEDHKRRLQQITKDSNRRLKELGAERDAYAIAEEKKRAADETNAENESFQTEKRRAAQDTAERLRQLDTQYRQEAAMRKQEYEYNLAAKKAEVEVARQAFQAILDAAARMLAGLTSIPGMNSTGMANNYRDAAPSTPKATKSSGSTQNLNITASNLTLNEVRRVASQTASQVTTSTLRRALVQKR